MSILTQLSKLNITPDKISNLNSTEIIRIEKILRAEVRLSDDLSINEVEEVLFLLKNNKSELQCLYSYYFKSFREVITSPNTLITFNVYAFSAIGYSDEFLVFISTYFEKELELYVINCTKEKHYSALFSLLKYKGVLNESFLDFISESLKLKIKSAIELLRLRSNGPFDKVDYISNPFFFRSITALGALAFEEDIIDLINIVTEYHLLNDFYFKVLFSFGEYKSSNLDISNVILDNRSVAIQNGVCEIRYRIEDKHKKGGTLINFNKNLSSNLSSNHLYDTDIGNSISISKVFLITFFLVFLFMLIILFVSIYV